MANASDLFLFDLVTRPRSPGPITYTDDPYTSFSIPLDFSRFSVSDAPSEEIDYGHIASRIGSGFEGGEDVGYDDHEADWSADDFFIGRRMSSPSSSIEFSRARPVDSEGLRVVGFDSDSDSDDQQIVAIGGGIEDGDGRDRAASAGVGLPLRWDCLQFGENRRDQNEEFEWEEVDARAEERDAISVTVIGDEERSEEIRELDNDEDETRDVEWEFLLAVNSLGRNTLDPEDVEPYFVDEPEGFGDASDNEAYEVLFGQFAEHESSIKGNPPAAKSVIDSLPSVLLTEEDVAKDNAVCAVCKDGILVEERVKRLPCSHLYHKDCILPWLAVRNSCPLCRFELPTDDPEYEKWKATRAARVVTDQESQVRYDFEVLPEAEAR
ncbi:E3 ubiquitin-protein ligase [Canna indica]|uniref:RING-type E3 ubiquitin transferase n=1 Tax=Canna indica TaxID=4628 RepID=A0AAQ3L235_9LILI|nr:E3 ubiquitin-protein ligase [Canna indica]